MPVSRLQTDRGLRRTASTCQSALDAYHGQMSRHHETGLSAITSLINIPSLTSTLETGWNGQEGSLLGKVGHARNREQCEREEFMVQI